MRAGAQRRNGYRVLLPFWSVLLAGHTSRQVGELTSRQRQASGANAMLERRRTPTASSAAQTHRVTPSIVAHGAPAPSPLSLLPSIPPSLATALVFGSYCSCSCSCSCSRSCSGVFALACAIALALALALAPVVVLHLQVLLLFALTPALARGVVQPPPWSRGAI